MFVFRPDLSPAARTVAKKLLEPYGKVDELDAFFEEGCTGPGKREAR